MLRIQENQCSVTNDIILIRKYDLALHKNITNDHDYNIPDVTKISEFKMAAITYIAGIVALKIYEKINCMACCNALGTKDKSEEFNFIKFKDNGSLFKPSSSVVKVYIYFFIYLLLQ